MLLQPASGGSRAKTKLPSWIDRPPPLAGRPLCVSFGASISSQRDDEPYEVISYERVRYRNGMGSQAHFRSATSQLANVLIDILSMPPARWCFRFQNRIADLVLAVVVMEDAFGAGFAFESGGDGCEILGGRRERLQKRRVLVVGPARGAALFTIHLQRHWVSDQRGACSRLKQPLEHPV